MRTKSFVLSVITVCIPFLFAVNILRTKLTGNENNYLLTSTSLEYVSEIDLSFSGTYYSIAQAGNAWQQVGSSDSFGSNVTNFLKALWTTMVIPIEIVKDLFGMVTDCCNVFIKFIGFMPNYTPNDTNKPSDADGPGFGGGGGRPT